MVKFTEDAKSTGYSIMEEGIHVLKVTELKPVKRNGRLVELKLTASNKKGEKVWNRYTLDINKSYYNNSMKALYSLLRTGCGLVEDENDEIHELDALGKYFVSEIRHVEGNDGRVFVNLGWIKGHAESFEDDISKYLDEADEKEEEEDIIFDDDEDDDPYA